MPRITGAKSQVSSTTGNSRATKTDMELQVGLNQKQLLNTPFTQLLNVASIKGDYYMIDRNETTFTERSKSVQSLDTSRRFKKIENFVVYLALSDEIELSSKPDERRLQIKLTPKQWLVNGNTIMPIEGDHFKPYAQEGIGSPYQLTVTNPANVIDRPAWVCEYKESEQFTLGELEARVTETYQYIEDNIGTGNKVIMHESDINAIKTLQEVMDTLNTVYVEAFYNTKYDLLAFNTEPNRMYYWNYLALVKFQLDKGILKYGFDKNTLFIESTYAYPIEEVNYRKNSLFTHLFNKTFVPVTESNKENDSLGGSVSVLFQDNIRLRDRINDDLGVVHTPKYDYTTKLYFKVHTNHLILTHLWNTRIVLVDMVNSLEYHDNPASIECINYTIKNPYITRVLDWYMDGRYDCIRRNLSSLKKFMPNKASIDDYFGVPMLLYVLDNIINDMSADMSTTGKSVYI